ncbi:hypothetical protein R3W88_026798 [Solanum pinnatisectum]|uniref:Uncharacterized protein n=1 Tax=Solanum pinnatisectum TaxID=50273 RepID=A0AAV9LF79_9SOLN|nr:hypothetical protein R3W88_026798 [Solanum pinnatisectum]
MVMVTRSRKIFDDTKVMTNKVASEKVVDGVKLSAPIRSATDENQVTEENVIDDEENEDYPLSVVKQAEETKGDEFTKGDVPKFPSISSKNVENKHNQFKKLLDLFSKLFVNIPLVMLSYKSQGIQSL